MSDYTKYSGIINIFPDELKMNYTLNVDYVNKSAKANKLEFIIYDDSSILVTNKDYIESVIIKEIDNPMPFIIA